MPENPWLENPWQDYEGHMSRPEVGQLPSAGGTVSATAYPSLRRLEPTMQLVDPDSLGLVAERAGLRIIGAIVHRTPTGKSMHPVHLCKRRRSGLGSDS